MFSKPGYAALAVVTKTSLKTSLKERKILKNIPQKMDQKISTKLWDYRLRITWLSTLYDRPFENFSILTFLARCLKNCLSHCLETWQADREWWVNDLINIQQNSGEHCGRRHKVSYCDHSVHCCHSHRPSINPSIHNFFKQHLLNHWANFHQILQDWILGDIDWKLFWKDFESMQDSGCHDNQKKKRLKVFLSETIGPILI